MGTRFRGALLSTIVAAAACHAPSPGLSANAPIAADARPEIGPNSLVVGQSVLELTLPTSASAERKAMLRDWIERSSRWVADYCDGFPVPTLDVTIVSRGRRAVGFGYHQDGRLVRVNVGSSADHEALGRDWVMIHELLHTGFPDLPNEYRWMQEGMSTYLEPIVRARHGELAPEDVWGRWYRNMHNGRPKRGDRGLDQTRTWGRTYWGGALFWLMVDIELRRSSANETTIRDVLLGILAEGGNGRADWSTLQVVQAADRATGNTVTSKLYERMALAPGDVDLDRLWGELGLVPDGHGGVELDDDAPLANIRRGITTR